MKSQNWNSNNKKLPSPLWSKVRTLSNNFVEPIINILEIPGSFIPGAGGALKKIKELFGSDLNISSVNDFLSVKPIDGSPAPLTSKSGEFPVFLEGFENTFTISHNNKGNENILIEYIELFMIKYAPGPDPFFSYKLKGEEIIGAGMVEPLKFFVEVDSHGVGLPRRSFKNKEGKTEILRSKSQNFFNTDPEMYYSLSPGEQPLIIKTKVLTLDEGFYELCFRFFYRIAAKELHQHTSEVIFVYNNG